MCRKLVKMDNMYDFYKRQIADFDRSLNDIDSLFEELANNDTLTNDEYSELFEIATNKFRI